MLTVKQAAERLGVSPGLIYSLVSARKIRYTRVGHGRGRLRIPEDALEEYVAKATFGVEETKPEPRRFRLKHLKL
jgi:excisionase family DNA binding protein